MNIKYLRNILDEAKECGTHAVVCDIEDFESMVAFIENHEDLPNEYADRRLRNAWKI